MKARFKESFARDLRALKDTSALPRIRETIENVEKAESLVSVPGIKKLRGGGAFYRIRVSDYRLGFAVQQDVVTFVRALHRREVYRYFP